MNQILSLHDSKIPLMNPEVVLGAVMHRICGRLWINHDDFVSRIAATVTALNHRTDEPARQG
jgi:hypothetical protein